MVEIFFEYTNADILGKLVKCIVQHPKDLYIVQTAPWYQTIVGQANAKYMKFRSRHNVEYNLPLPQSWHNKRLPDLTSSSKLMHWNNYIIKEPPKVKSFNQYHTEFMPK